MTGKNRKYALNQSPFYKLHSKRRLAALLRVPLLALRAFKNSESLYRETEIPKRNGGLRRIENPRRNLKIVQARVARLLGRIVPPDYLFCPVKGRSYIDNAARHLGHRVIRTLDIKKYFPSTKRCRVFGFFHFTMQCSPDVASILADIATYKGHLPTGSPLSPIMAFYAYLDVWNQVHQIVLQNSATDSLYIDDITISGERFSKRLMWDIKRAIHRSGLRYHKEKLFVDSPAEITGVMLRDGKLTVPNRQLLKRYRAEGAKARTHGESEKQRLISQLKGLNGQIRQIQQAQARSAAPTRLI